MKITRITFDTDDGRSFELADKEELDEFFNNPNYGYCMLLGLSFTNDLSGGFKWRLISDPPPLPFLSPLVALRDTYQTQLEGAHRNLRKEISHARQKTNSTTPPSDTG